MSMVMCPQELLILNTNCMTELAATYLTVDQWTGNSIIVFCKTRLCDALKLGIDHTPARAGIHLDPLSSNFR